MNKLLSFGKWVLARIEEPSTWSGTGIAAVVLAQFLPPDLLHAVLTTLGSIGALLAIVLPEKSA